MKTFNYLMMSSLLMLLFGQVSATQVTIPNTFTSGTPAVATDVNDNFTAVKSAVDDNDSRVSDNNSLIGNNDARLMLNESRLSNIETGVVSVNSRAFVDDGGGVDSCTILHTFSLGYSFYPAIGGTSFCDAVAGVQLPDGRTMTQLDCTVYDNSGVVVTNVIDCRLYRVNLTTGPVSELVFFTAGSIDSTSVQTLTDTTPASGMEVIDNSTYSYYVAFVNSTSDFSGLSSNARYYGMRITYQ